MTRLALIDSGDGLPEYPADLIDARMTSDYFTVFWHDRWLNSELCLTARMDVQGTALNLFWIARKQNPIGALPANDDMLAKLLRIDREYWLELKGRPISPLHNWQRMRAGEKIVLGHPVVIEIALDALGRREIREAAQSEKAAAMRVKRLGEMMVEIGCDARMADDRALLGRLDDWLLENHKGQRRMPRFETSLKAALRHAEAAGWLQRRGPER